MNSNNQFSGLFKPKSLGKPVKDADGFTKPLLRAQSRERHERSAEKEKPLMLTPKTPMNLSQKEFGFGQREVREQPQQQQRDFKDFSQREQTRETLREVRNEAVLREQKEFTTREKEFNQQISSQAPQPQNSIFNNSQPNNPPPPSTIKQAQPLSINYSHQTTTNIQPQPVNPINPENSPEEYEIIAKCLSALTQKLNQSQSTTQSQSQKITQLTAQIQSLTETQQKLNTTNNFLKNENSDLKQSLKEMENVKNVLFVDFSEIKAKYEVLQSEYELVKEKHETEVKALNEQLEKEKQEKEMVKNEKESKLIDEIKNELLKNNENFKEEFKEISQHFQDTNKFTCEIVELKQENLKAAEKLLIYANKQVKQNLLLKQLESKLPEKKFYKDQCVETDNEYEEIVKNCYLLRKERDELLVKLEEVEEEMGSLNLTVKELEEEQKKESRECGVDAAVQVDLIKEEEPTIKRVKGNENEVGNIIVSSGAGGNSDVVRKVKVDFNDDDDSPQVGMVANRKYRKRRY